MQVTDTADPDISNALEVLGDPLLYSEYLNQLGTVGVRTLSSATTKLTLTRSLRMNRTESDQQDVNEGCEPTLSFSQCTRAYRTST